MRLAADIQQSDPRRRVTAQLSGRGSAHDRKLDQLFGRAIYVRTQIKDMTQAPRSRQCGHDCRPTNTLKGAQHRTRKHHQRTGIARTQTAINLPVPDQLKSNTHGGIALTAQHAGRRIISENLFTGRTK